MTSDQQTASSVDPGWVINDWSDRERGAYLRGRSESHTACDRDRAAHLAAERSEQENAELRAALTEITELELEGDASLDDAIAIAQEALDAALGAVGEA